MQIDLSRFKVVYDEKVLNALAVDGMMFRENEYPTIDEPCIHKPQFITIFAINEDGNIIAITDEAWRFRFLPIVKGG